MAGRAEKLTDFFISRAGADAAFADQIGRILEDAGHTVIVQQWDFANRNFMERMDTALATANRVIALLSNEYLVSDHCTAEWLNFTAHDPLNKQGRLIVMRVDECTPDGLLKALTFWDVVPLRAEPALLRDVVLAAVKPGRHKGEATPGAQYWREARAAVHHDIKATPYSKIGDVFRKQGNLAQALESYQASLTIAERLAEADAGNAVWQYDVALMLQRIGLVTADGEQRDDALKAYQRGRRIMKRLVALAPNHADYRGDHAWLEDRIAELGE